MDSFLKMSPKDRRLTCLQVEERMHLQAASVEKDFWVCWTLRELFGLPEDGPHLTFKGGTSLSKAWKLIERFSEDIDVVLDRGFLGFGGEKRPEKAPSNKQREKRLEELKLACQQRIRGSLKTQLNARFQNTLPTGAPWDLVDDGTDPDGQTLLFHYPATCGEAAYIRPVVKIELGARSDTEPCATPEIRPYLVEAFPSAFTQ